MSLCLQTYPGSNWLNRSEVYITDVLGTQNYSWPHEWKDDIYPATNIFDIYNSTNGFFAKLNYAGTHMYGYNQIYTYCLEDQRI